MRTSRWPTLVLNAGYGAQVAGPEVKAFLDAS